MTHYLGGVIFWTHSPKCSLSRHLGHNICAFLKHFLTKFIDYVILACGWWICSFSLRPKKKVLGGVLFGQSKSGAFYFWGFKPGFFFSKADSSIVFFSGRAESSRFGDFWETVVGGGAIINGWGPVAPRLTLTRPSLALAAELSPAAGALPPCSAAHIRPMEKFLSKVLDEQFRAGRFLALATLKVLPIFLSLLFFLFFAAYYFPGLVRLNLLNSNF